MTAPLYPVTSEDKQKFVSSRRKRNLAIGLGLLTFIVTIYFVTLFKLGSLLFA